MKCKVVIITGGVSVIGRSTAIAFAREGPTVVIGDLDKPGGEKTASTIKDTMWGCSLYARRFFMSHLWFIHCFRVDRFSAILMNSRRRPLYRPVVFVDD
jgi:NAD(P)-dependent dehydrogenase (short-subunit alcohol dehydrogenase family)